MTPVRVHIQLPYGLDASKTREQFAAGLTPDAVAYGFHHAEALCETVTYSRDHPENRVQRFVRKRLSRLLRFDLIHAWRNRRDIAKADIVWTMLETDYLAVAALASVSQSARGKPIIGQSVWLFNDFSRLGAARRRLYKALIARVAIMTTHSERCLPVMRQALPETDSRQLYFGISGDTFALTDPSDTEPADGPLRIFAAGNDRTRDWDTLLEAFGNDERFALTIVCGWLPDSHAQTYRNLTLVRNPSMAQFVALYRSHDFAAAPMVENIYSGITVALEAAALGAPILSSRTGGVPTYFDETEVFYAAPGDAGDLRRTALASTLRERRERALRAQRRFVASDYTTRGMIGRYMALTREILGEP